MSAAGALQGVPGRPKQGMAPSGGREPHAAGDRGGSSWTAAAPGRPKQGMAPSGGRKPHAVGARGGSS